MALRQLRWVGVAVALGFAATRVAAATFSVDTTVDAVDATPGDGVCATASGDCALRAATEEANALAGPDEIDLPAGLYLLTLAGPPEDAGASGDLDVREGLRLIGAGATTTIIDAGGATPVLEAGVSILPPPLAVLEIAGVTLRNGALESGDDCDGVFPLSAAAGLCANGLALELRDAVVEGNAGDGISSLGSVTIERSTVRDNLRLGSLGTGLAVLFGPLAIRDSTFSGNGAAGVSAPAVAIDIRNSTFHDNRTGLAVGFVCEPPVIPCPSPPPVALVNVTMTDHSRTAIHDEVLVHPGGGVGSVPVGVSNSVFSGNASDCIGSLESFGHTAFGSPSGCAISSGPGDVPGAAASLGSLQDNGGPTETRLPGANSALVNAGNPAPPGGGVPTCEPSDQRGVARPIGTICDIGAVETSCGDGVLDPSETCDDGNAIDGDGCQRNCTSPGCGNGIVESGEACDDGNLANGDCCGAGCDLEPADTPCADDGDACTADACDGAGLCLHPTAPDGTACDDGNACSIDDQCHSGTCLGFACPFCTVCSPEVGCVAPPDTCADAARSRVRVRDEPGRDADVVRWTWVGATPVTMSEFGGVPSGLCGEDGSGLAFLLTGTGASGGCDSFGCWTTKGKRREFVSGAATPGKVKIIFVEGPPPRIKVRARGPAADPPGLPFSPPVRFWFQRVDNGDCWDATFAGSAVRKNTPRLFAAH
jgi:cysteine-rich repeat protein